MCHVVPRTPYYGATRDGRRGGFNESFVDRVRRAEYPEYMWDSLPVGSRTDESILMLNQLQPIGRHHNAHEVTPHRLSESALDVVDEWLEWLLRGTLDSDGVLAMFRGEIAKLEDR